MTTRRKIKKKRKVITKLFLLNANAKRKRKAIVKFFTLHAKINKSKFGLDHIRLKFGLSS